MITDLSANGGLGKGHHVTIASLSSQGCYSPFSTTDSQEIPRIPDALWYTWACDIRPYRSVHMHRHSISLLYYVSYHNQNICFAISVDSFLWVTISALLEALSERPGRALKQGRPATHPSAQSLKMGHSGRSREPYREGSIDWRQVHLIGSELPTAFVLGPYQHWRHFVPAVPVIHNLYV